MIKISWKWVYPLRVLSYHVMLFAKRAHRYHDPNAYVSRKRTFARMFNRIKTILINRNRHIYEYEFDMSDNNAPSKVVRMVGLDKRVLEIGAGPGSITRVLKNNNGCRITGIDIDPSTMEKLSQFCDQVYHCDLNSPEWTLKLSECGTFDVIVAADVFEHLNSPSEVLISLKPLLSPEGYIVVSLPHVGNNAIIACLLNSDFDYRDFGLLDKSHIRFFGIKNMQDFIENSGYIILEAEFVLIVPQETELANQWKKLPKNIKSVLKNNPYGMIYQVVMKIGPARAGQNGLQLTDIKIPGYNDMPLGG